MESISAENSTLKLDSSFRNTRIEDLCLDFSLPGYPDYVLTSKPDHEVRLPQNNVCVFENFNLLKREFNCLHVFLGKYEKLGGLYYMRRGCNYKCWNF